MNENQFILVSIRKEYVSKKDNKKHIAINFFLQDKYGSLIAVKPSFAEDFGVMKYLAKDVTGEKK